MKLAILVALLTLTGCTTTRYATVFCVTEEQAAELKAAEPPRVGARLTGQAQEDSKIIAQSAIELRAWSDGLMGVIEGCTGGLTP